ncbi:MAG: hypothetical protein RIR00_252 [Pseudomonadota bacterium]|jgi:uncharacterized protein YigA (DUF484 family)
MNSDDIAQYLVSHPEFFEQYADLLSQIYVPHQHGGRAVSLAERQMQTLREKNKQLDSKLAEMIAFGEENDVISDKLHRLAVAMVAAETLQSVISLFNFHLREDFSVPLVSLRLWECPPDEDPELPEFFPVGAELQTYTENLVYPYCGSTSGFPTEAWFGERAAHIRSQALVPLRNAGGTFGMVALGSEDVRRFFPDMDTIYLQRLGEIVSAALGRVTRVPVLGE